MGTFTLYHGGQRWAGRPEIRPAKEGDYEGGTGLYFTTSWLTAKSHAKGGKVITVAQIADDFTPIDDVTIEREKIVEFLKDTRMKSKVSILADIDANIARRNKGSAIPASVLHNLVVNYRAGAGLAGVAVAEFLASHGVDAEIQRKSAEDWFLFFNPKVIKSHRVLNPKEDTIYDLPRIEDPSPSLEGKSSRSSCALRSPHLTR